MISKEYMRKIYRRFSDFVAIASARELEYFILDSRFTSSFNYRVKEMVNEIKQEKNDDIEFSIIFNTNGEIAVIDANILGRYIGYNYNIKIAEYYKEAALNKIIRDVINGSEKTQTDFISISYAVLYNTLITMYREIKCNKEVADKYRRDYFLTEYEGEDIGAIVSCILIIEDICRYIGIRENLVLKAVNAVILRKNL